MCMIPLLNGRFLQRKTLKFMGAKAERYTKFTASMAVFKTETYQ
jgi:hypothetical protein